MRKSSLSSLSVKDHAPRIVLHKNTSVFGEFGCVHDSVVGKLRTMKPREARMFLQDLWFSRREQDALLRWVKAL